MEQFNIKISIYKENPLEVSDLSLIYPSHYQIFIFPFYT